MAVRCGTYASAPDILTDDDKKMADSGRGCVTLRRYSRSASISDYRRRLNGVVVLPFARLITMCDESRSKSNVIFALIMMLPLVIDEGRLVRWLVELRVC